MGGPAEPVLPAGAAPAVRAPVNQPPEQAALATFIIREIVALLFVGVWLLLLVVSLVSGLFEVPFWLSCTGVAIMAYALGMNIAELNVFRLLSAVGPGPGPG
jgi:hypothetical protein